MSNSGSGLSFKVGLDGGAVDPEVLSEFADRGSGGTLHDQVVDLWGSEPGLPLAHAPRTGRGLPAALSAIFRGRNPVTRGFRV